MFTDSPLGLAWGAAFTGLLLTACVTDIRARRIPNTLVLAILLLGLLYATASGPVLPSLGQSVLGVAVGFGIWILFYVVGALGAGDVKLFAAAGAWLGPADAWRAALVAAVAGGVLAIMFLVRERRLGRFARNVALAASARSLGVVVDKPDMASPAHGRLPYGVPLAIGALVTAWLPHLF